MSELYKKRIFVIDDSEFASTLLSAKLRKIGYVNFEVFNSSIEAYQKIAEDCLDGNVIDLLITDMNMPNFDGMDLIVKIKDEEISKDMKIIVVSGDADPSVINIAKRLGADAYIVKPLVTKDLALVVEAVLLGTDIPEVKGMFG